MLSAFFDPYKIKIKTKSMENAQNMEQNCQPAQPAKQLEGKPEVFNADFAFVAVTVSAVYCYTLLYTFMFLM